MQGATWSTTGVPDREALTRWNDVVRQTLCAMDISSPATRFHAYLNQTQLGCVCLSDLATGPQQVHRSRGDISRDTRERDTEVTLDLIQLWTGTMEFEQAGQENTLVAGDCVVLDRTQPYRFSVSETSTMSLNMPYAWLKGWTADPSALVGRRIDGARGWGLALSTMLRQLEIDEIDKYALPRATIADQIAALLVLACAPSASLARPSDRLRRRAMDVIHAHAHDPEMNPDGAAAELGISKRYLHAVFAAAGTSFGRELNAVRLAKARAMIENPRYRDLPIGELAWRCGFLDQGHFAKRFRERFGISPTSLRATVA